MGWRVSSLLGPRGEEERTADHTRLRHGRGRKAELRICSNALDFGGQACRSGVRTTSPSNSSLTLIWHDSREFG
jgi:hypothetical protein